MPLLPIDPSISGVGAGLPGAGSEWSVGGVGGLGGAGGADGAAEAAQPASGEGFGDMLSNAITSLERTQTDAAEASQSLVAGTATDPTQVVMAVERARLAMQMASQIRTKTVEAYNDVFHTQV